VHARASAQGACGRLVAGDSPGECRALVSACAGLAPFVVQALRTLAERCARLPESCQWAGALSGDRVCCCLLRVRRMRARSQPNTCRCMRPRARLRWLYAALAEGLQWARERAWL